MKRALMDRVTYLLTPPNAAGISRRIVVRPSLWNRLLLALIVGVEQGGK